MLLDRRSLQRRVVRVLKRRAVLDGRRTCTEDDLRGGCHLVRFLLVSPLLATRVDKLTIRALVVAPRLLKRLVHVQRVILDLRSRFSVPGSELMGVVRRALVKQGHMAAAKLLSGWRLCRGTGGEEGGGEGGGSSSLRLRPRRRCRRALSFDDVEEEDGTVWEDVASSVRVGAHCLPSVVRGVASVLEGSSVCCGPDPTACDEAARRAVLLAFNLLFDRRLRQELEA